MEAHSPGKEKSSSVGKWPRGPGFCILYINDSWRQMSFPVRLSSELKEKSISDPQLGMPGAYDQHLT